MGFMVSRIIFEGFYNIDFTVIAKNKVYRFIFLHPFTVGLYITACGNDNGIRVHLLCLVKHLTGLAVGNICYGTGVDNIHVCRNIFIKRNNGITCGAKHLFHGFCFIRIDLTAEVMNCNFFQFFCSCLLFLY